MPTRREWLVYTGLTGLAAATGTLARTEARTSVPAGSAAPGTGLAGEVAPATPRGLASVALPSTPEAPPPWWAFAPLREGSALAAGWSLISLSTVRDGRAELVLEHEDDGRAEIHLRRHEPTFENPEGAGVAHSHHFDFLLMNGSGGEEGTQETLGRLILGLAAHVRRNELNAPEGAMASFTAHDETSDGTARA